MLHVFQRGTLGSRSVWCFKKRFDDRHRRPSRLAHFKRYWTPKALSSTFDFRDEDGGGPMIFEGGMPWTGQLDDGAARRSVRAGFEGLFRPQCRLCDVERRGRGPFISP